MIKVEWHIIDVTGSIYFFTRSLWHSVPLEPAFGQIELGRVVALHLHTAALLDSVPVVCVDGNVDHYKLVITCDTPLAALAPCSH